LNLVLNAIDATPRDGRIEVAVTRTRAGVEVAVSDDGSGVAAADAPRLFHPYFTTKQHGTGLGLFVTRTLVEEHGGAVAYEPRPGGGAVFRVRLPLAADARAVVPFGREPEASAPPAANGEAAPW